MWPNGRLNTRAHDFDLEAELAVQQGYLRQFTERDGRDSVSVRAVKENIEAIRSEQYRREGARSLRLSIPSR